MLMTRNQPSLAAEVLAPQEAGRELLRHVDRAALDQLTVAFIGAVGLPAAVLSPLGHLIAGDPYCCPACVVASGSKPGPAYDAAVVSGWARCRHGLSSVIASISGRTGELLGAVRVGPLAHSEAEVAAVRRALLARGDAERVVRAHLNGVPRSSAERAEAAARLLAQTLDTVVREAAIASEHAGLVATQRQANRELTVLYSISRALGTGIELQAILQRLVDSVGEFLGSEVVLVGLIERDDLVTVASRGLLTFEARNGRLKMGEGLAGRVAATGEPLTCRDMQEDPRQYLTAINSREDLHAFAGVPLKLQGSTVGVLAVYRRSVHLFPESELQLLTHIADLAAVAMERARLYEQERHTVNELRTLHTRIEAQHRALERATAVHDQLTELVLQDAGLAAIVDSLARSLEAPVVVEDQFLHPLAYGPCSPMPDAAAPAERAPAWTPQAALEDSEVRRLFEAVRDSRRPVTVAAAPELGLEFPRTVAPVIVGGDLLGFLSVVERDRPLEEPDLLAIGHAATVVALEMMKQRTRAEVERRLRGELLEELVAGELSDPEVLQRRAAYLGYNLSLPHAVMLFIADPQAASRINPTLLPPRDVRSSLTEALEELVWQRDDRAMLLPQHDGLFVAFPLGEGTLAEVRQAGETLRAGAAHGTGNTITVGIGSICLSPEDFALAAGEARRAIALAKALGVADRVVAFEDLGLYRLLIDLPRPSDAARFAEQLLQPLEAYDRQHGTALTATLEAYLAANGVLQRAASQLAVHVNTLTYRLQRIREITGVDLNDSDARLGLHLAVKIRQVVRSTVG